MLVYNYTPATGATVLHGLCLASPFAPPQELQTKQTPPLCVYVDRLVYATMTGMRRCEAAEGL